jgi:hypothetical protein
MNCRYELEVSEVMTIELTANGIDCVSYEGFPLSVHVFLSILRFGYLYESSYDCNLRHAFVTLNEMGCEVKQLRVVSS